MLTLTIRSRNTKNTEFDVIAGETFVADAGRMANDTKRFYDPKGRALKKIVEIAEKHMCGIGRRGIFTVIKVHSQAAEKEIAAVLVKTELSR